MVFRHHESRPASDDTEAGATPRTRTSMWQFQTQGTVTGCVAKYEARAAAAAVPTATAPQEMKRACGPRMMVYAYPVGSGQRKM
jgi:hypothetical protein